MTAVSAMIRTTAARGELWPGDRINEVSLSKMFDVSRGVVREAVRSLETENLVTYEAQKGVRIRKLGSADARDLYGIRIGLAMVASPTIVENVTPASLDALEDAYARMNACIDAGDLPRFHETNRQFHIFLFSLAGNKRLLDLYMRLFDEVYLLRSLNFLSEGSTRRSQKGHRRIVDALKTGDRDRVRDVITGHIATSRDFVVSIIEAGEGAENGS